MEREGGGGGAASEPAGAAPGADSAVASPLQATLARLSRAVRILVACALILLSVWSVLLPMSLPISTVAAVTARLASVPAPISGEVMMLAADTGDVVGRGQLMAELGTRRPQLSAAQAALIAEQADLEAQLAAIRDEQRAIEGLKGDYVQQAERYRAQLVGEAEGDLLEATRSCEVHAAAAARAKSEYEFLLARPEGEQPSAVEELALARAQREMELAERQLAIETVRQRRWAERVADAKAGYFQALGYEQPRYERLVEEADVRLAKLGVEERRLERLVQATDGQRTELVRRERHATERRVECPVVGVVWTRPVNVGQFVQTTTELYRVADAASTHVQAYFHRRYLDGMAIGDKARIYLVAARRVVTGTVKVIQAVDVGSGVERYAIDLPVPDEDHFKVVLELGPEERQAAQIGGVAKVAVIGKLDSELERIMMWLYLRFES